MPAELVLHNRAAMSQSTPRARRWSMIFAGVMIAGMFAMMFWTISVLNDKPVDWSKMGARFVDSVTRDSWKLLQFAVITLGAIAHLTYLALSKRRERLIVTELGIRYVSPLPSALQFLRPNWSLQWNQVRRVEFKSNAIGSDASFLTLVFDAGFVKRSIRPYWWIDPATYQPSSWKNNFRRGTKTYEAIAADVMNSPLVQFIQKLPSLKLALPTVGKLTSFALEKNPTALGIAAFFLVCVIYSIIDVAINFETYIDEPFYGVYIAGGTALFAVALWLLRRAKVPKRESLVVAVMAAGAFGAALYPGLLRINELSDTQGLIAHEYKMVQSSYFVPLEQGLPELRFPEHHTLFWSHYEPGHVEKFQLRKGGLGFYQIYMFSIHERINDFYTSRH